MSPPDRSSPDEESVVLTVQQAAKLLQCSDNHVYSQVAQNKIPHLRVGKLIRIPHWGLLQFIARSASAPFPDSAELDAPAIQSVDALQPNDEEDNDGKR